MGVKGFVGEFVSVGSNGFVEEFVLVESKEGVKAVRSGFVEVSSWAKDWSWIE